MGKYKETYNEKLDSKVWMGIIVDNNDPERIGRVKIRIFEKFDQRPFIDDKGNYPDKPLTLEDYLDESHFIIKTDDLPWMFPMQSTVFAGGDVPGYGSFSFPKLGTLVRVKFVNDDIYSGEYTAVVSANKLLLSKIAPDGDYENASVTVLDEDENYWILYTKTTGLQIFHKESQIVIRPDSSIYIEHKDSESLQEFKGPNIKIVSNRDIDITSENKITHNSNFVHVNGDKTYIGANPNFSAVNGEPLIKLLQALATMIDGKWSPTPGIATSAVNASKNMILSRTVKTSL